MWMLYVWDAERSEWHSAGEFRSAADAEQEVRRYWESGCFVLRHPEAPEAYWDWDTRSFTTEDKCAANH